MKLNIEEKIKNVLMNRENLVKELKNKMTPNLNNNATFNMNPQSLNFNTGQTTTAFSTNKVGFSFNINKQQNELSIFKNVSQQSNLK